MNALPISPLLEILENIVETFYKVVYYIMITKQMLILQLLPNIYQKTFTHFYLKTSTVASITLA